jgi:hypothetical protein
VLSDPIRLILDVKITGNSRTRDDKSRSNDLTIASSPPVDQSLAPPMLIPLLLQPRGKQSGGGVSSLAKPMLARTGTRADIYK